VINIDQLKQVNDNWSVEMGDKILARVGKILRDVCRTADLPARLKGDKFAVILTDTAMEGGVRLSQRLHTAFSGISDWHGGGAGPNYVSFSAGLVQFDEQQDQAPMHFFQRAERALYLAKSMGGGRTKQG
jgi:diguanylate cyclase (GGDEF)-like protein